MVRMKGVLMCFSAQMSFLAAAVLTVVSAMTFRTVRKLEQLPLATIPLIFAIQQFAEGILWVLLPTGSYPLALLLAKYTFLAIAFCVWPLYMPLSLLALENTLLRRYLLATLSVLGLAWSFVSAWYIATYGASVEIESCHLLYQIVGLAKDKYLPAVLYSLTTIVPFFVANSRTLHILGGIIALSFIAAYLFYYTYFISVWCFFAAIVSVSIYSVLRSHLV